MSIFHVFGDKACICVRVLLAIKLRGMMSAVQRDVLSIIVRLWFQDTNDLWYLVTQLVCRTLYFFAFVLHLV